MPLKPRLVLGVLFVASAAGVVLTWRGTGEAVVVPVASWIAILSLGTLWANGLLWLRYTRDGAANPPWLGRRWSRLGALAAGGAVAGLVLRLLGSSTGPARSQSLVFTITTVLIAVGLVTVLVGRHRDRDLSRVGVLLVALAAGVGLVGFAVETVHRGGGSLSTAVVKGIHLTAVGTWIGGAVWHNTIVVPAIKTGAKTNIRPTLQRFRRTVPLIITVVLLTGVFQAVTWLGTGLSPYLTTTTGDLLLGKLAAVLGLSAIVVHSRRRSQRARPVQDSPSP